MHTALIPSNLKSKKVIPLAIGSCKEIRKESGHYNIMESAISQLVSQYLEENIQYIGVLDPIDIEAYVLNRVPALYATTSKGYNQQLKKVLKDPKRRQIMKLIAEAVKQISIDPLRYEKNNPIAFSNVSDSGSNLPESEAEIKLKEANHYLSCLAKTLGCKENWDEVQFNLIRQMKTKPNPS